MKTNKLALAASMMVLVAISGQAFADTAKPHRTETASERQVHAFNASHAAMAPETGPVNTHPYHGGPKVND
jgi:hypothetical protein